MEQNSSGMSAKEVSLKVYLMKTFYSKVVCQKWVFFTNIGKNSSLKDYS